MPNTNIESAFDASKLQKHDSSREDASSRLLEGAMNLGRGASDSMNNLVKRDGTEGGHGGGGGRGPNHLERHLPKELDCSAPIQGFDDKLNNQLTDKMDDKLGDKLNTQLDDKLKDKTRSLNPGEDIRKEEHSKDVNRQDGARDRDQNNSDKSVDKMPSNPNPWEHRQDGRGLQPRQHEQRLAPPQPSKIWS